jgi:hypothetical protein
MSSIICIVFLSILDNVKTNRNKCYGTKLTLLIFLSQAPVKIPILKSEHKLLLPYCFCPPPTQPTPVMCINKNQDKKYPEKNARLRWTSEVSEELNINKLTTFLLDV